MEDKTVRFYYIGSFLTAQKARVILTTAHNSLIKSHITLLMPLYQFLTTMNNEATRLNIKPLP